MSLKFHFQSKRTKYYVISTKNDKNGHDISTSLKPDGALTVHPKAPGIVTITGVEGLYIALRVSLHLCILLWDLVLHESDLGRCPVHQAHLVRQGIHLANQTDSGWGQLVSHYVD